MNTWTSYLILGVVIVLRLVLMAGDESVSLFGLYPTEAPSGSLR